MQGFELVWELPDNRRDTYFLCLYAGYDNRHGYHTGYSIIAVVDCDQGDALVKPTGESIMTIDEASSFFRDFAPGDLIYGTQIDRQLYFTLAQKKSTKFTIDQITLEMDDTLRGWGDFAKDKTQREIELLPQQAQVFLCYAKRTKFWAKMQGVNTSQYTKNGVAKARIDLGNRLQWSEAYFRAKCKAGIGFVLDSGLSIRFVLDSLWNEAGMEAVARKESDQPWHTGSELRYICRHWDQMKTTRRVVFYVDGEPVAAPWERFPNSWANYGRTRMDDLHVPDFARRT